MSTAPGRLERLNRRWESMPGNLRGIAWLLASGVLFTVSAALIKAAGTRYDASQIVFARCLVGLLVVIPFVLPHASEALRTPFRRFHIARSLVGLLATFTSFFAFTHLGLAEAITLTFTQPLFALILAAFLLAERVGWRRSTAAAVGFAGVVVMMRPGAEAIQPAALAALAAAFLIALAVTLVKKLPGSERPTTMLFYYGLVGTAVSAPFAAAVWRTPDLADTGLLLAIGVASMLGQSFIIRAYRAGQAATVAPFDYVRLLHATVIGYLVFGELPNAWTWAGAGLIVLSTLYIALREAQLRRRKARK